ncbi:uncharacterized protein LOC114787909 [Denticeps clupeoides]|uniref:uncharacterized protein LOC114787909 n=1 Tax=Denticeps clupeoides TaxID=299321 RepID=UPI0010A4E88F|nr:uncharacterized protein LOC114787909 [Denticeps clupeoides]
MESSINVKSLRAKFQEEAQDKSRPPVPGKPRRLPVAGPRCASLMTSFNTSVGTKTMPVLPKVPVKEQPSAHPSATSGTVGSNHVGTAKPLFKDIHLPLVLPIPFSAEPRHHSPPKGAIPTSTCQKAAFMPLKSEEAEQGSAVGAAKPAHGCFRNREGSKRESRHPCPETPPQADPASPTDHGVLSTMEKAKRKFSPKQLLEYARPKGFYSSSPPTVSPPPSSTDYENLASDRTPLPPHCEGFTHATTYHAPSSLFPASATSRVQLHALKSGGEPCSSHTPLVKFLPDERSIGPAPAKPARPPVVDLSLYWTFNVPQNVSKQEAPEEKGMEQLELEAPEFPDFPEPENIEVSAIDLSKLDLVPAGSEAPVIVSALPKGLDTRVHSLPEPRSRSLETAADSEASAVAAWNQDSGGHGEQTAEPLPADVPDELPSEPSFGRRDSIYELSDNVYEDVQTVKRFQFGQNSRKRKGPPKNPYAESPPAKEGTRKSVRSVTHWPSVKGDLYGFNHTLGDRKERGSPEILQRRKEKQRVEKEKKEQKEREKKENEMKKKFKVTGQEEPMYHARVIVAGKVRKHDLPVKSGDTVSIIRTTNCPKGKWLARDTNQKYGYISVMNVELNIKEMMELGKKVSQGASRGANEGDSISVGSRSPSHNTVLNSSFTDDSEEWTCDDDTLSPTADLMSQSRAVSLPDIPYSTHLSQSDGAMEDIHPHVRHEALQKLAVFFQHAKKNDSSDAAENEEATVANPENPGFLCDVDEPPYIEEQEEEAIGFVDMELLPPPDLYADDL